VGGVSGVEEAFNAVQTMVAAVQDRQALFGAKGFGRVDGFDMLKEQF